MKKLPISAIILTLNEALTLEEALRSLVSWVDEIYIVDSYSSDKTLEIARRYTEKIVQHHFENYAQQRNWAQDNLELRNEWVFHLDADERATPELVEALTRAFSNDLNLIAGFMVSRRTVFLGKWIRHGGHYPAYHARIFKKKSGRCEDRLYDQHFCVDGTVELLAGDIIDVITKDIKGWLRKMRVTADLEAREITGVEAQPPRETYVIKGERNGDPIKRKRWLRQQYYKAPLFIRPFLYFFYRYFFACGFLDGGRGFLFHILQGLWFRLLVDASIFKYRLLETFQKR